MCGGVRVVTYGGVSVVGRVCVGYVFDVVWGFLRLWIRIF